MGLIYQPTWIRQPAGPGTRINRSNGLTRGLAGLVLPTSGLAELARGGNLQLDSAVGFSGGQSGLGYDFDGSSTGLTVPISLSGDAYTIFSVVQSSTASGTRNVCSLGNGVAYAAQLRIDGANWSFYQAASGDFLAGETGTVVAGQIETVGATWEGAASQAMRFYRRGVERGANTVSTVRTSTDWRIGEDNFGAKQAWLGRIYLCAVWDRALSAAEHAQLNFNPWQLFAPLPRLIWAPSGAFVPPPVGTLGQFDPEMRLSAWF